MNITQLGLGLQEREYPASRLMMSDSHFYLLCCHPHLYPESIIRNVMALDERCFVEIKELGLSVWIQDSEKGTAKICKMGERSRIHWKQKITV